MDKWRFMLFDYCTCLGKGDIEKKSIGLGIDLGVSNDALGDGVNQFERIV
jgi:hypothetical protein